MAIITPTPIIMSDVVLTIAADNYELNVSKVQFDPTVPMTTWKGMTPAAVYPVVGTPSWALSLDYVQDASALTSLSEYLRLNNGTQKTVVFKPKKPTSTGPTYTIDVIIVAGPLGGAVDSVAVGSVTLPCVGQPVRTVA